MTKPQYIVDDEGKRVGVLLTIEDYESLLDRLDDEYCNKLFENAIEANEPNTSLEEYLTKRKKSAANG